MDTNDINAYRDDTPQGDQTEQAGTARPLMPDVPPVYHQPYTPQQSWPPPPPPRKRKGKGALIALMLVLCFLGGTALGTFVVAPNLDEIIGPQVAEIITPQPDENDVIAQMPEIGGEAPFIDRNRDTIPQIAKEVGPAVVGISVSAEQTLRGQAENIELGSGSGIIVTTDGYIVTNYHVVEVGEFFTVTLTDGTEYDADLIGWDIVTDLAVIKVDVEGLVAAALGNSNTVEVGETVIAIGNPFGSAFASSVTAGIVSALNRDIWTESGFNQMYIQTDAAINRGNSGGALINMRGEVIGINTLKMVPDITAEGLGFAIPISTAEPIIQQLIATGSMPRPGVGITVAVDDTGQNGAPAGVVVASVARGGPADLSGLKVEDVILSIDGTAIATPQDVQDQIKRKAVGDTLVMNVWRSGHQIDVTVTIGDFNVFGVGR